MFEQLIDANVKPADIRVGSNVLMSGKSLSGRPSRCIDDLPPGYSTSCTNDANVNFTASQIALTLPANWDGPFDVVLPVGGTAITVLAGGLLGFAALMLLSNLE
jgi:hypothetical protein